MHFVHATTKYREQSDLGDAEDKVNHRLGRIDLFDQCLKEEKKRIKWRSFKRSNCTVFEGLKWFYIKNM